MTEHKTSKSSQVIIPVYKYFFSIERMRLKLQGFYYTVENIHGASNPSNYPDIVFLQQ